MRGSLTRWQASAVDIFSREIFGAATSSQMIRNERGARLTRRYFIGNAGFVGANAIADDGRPRSSMRCGFNSGESLISISPKRR